jgi:hypothetical protein
VTERATLRQRLQAVMKSGHLKRVGLNSTQWCEATKVLAKEDGITRQGLTKYLAGGSKTIAYEIVILLADAAKLDRAWVLDGEDTVPRTAAEGHGRRIEELAAHLKTKDELLDYYRAENARLAAALSKYEPAAALAPKPLPIPAPCDAAADAAPGDAARSHVRKKKQG